jgi:deferrochelatase/peroxidase EfeB
MGEMPYAACVLISLPCGHDDRRQWLARMMDETRAAPMPPLRFGDRTTATKETSAAFIAFSAAGLAKFGLPEVDGEPGLASFPNAFTVGMNRRREVLGDPLAADWAWSDDEADAAVLIYGLEREACRAAVAALRAELEAYGGQLLKVVQTEPAPAPAAHGEARRGVDAPLRLDYEHFGFRDGISQPVIRGTRRFSQGAALRDVVEPGEFLFGYRANQGYFPPSLVVAAGGDRGDWLPIAAAEAPERFPDFGANAPSTGFRDFGRNGSFLVIRQLRQNVKGFHDFTAEAAADLNRRYPRLQAVVGEPVNGDWIASKMMGRRKNGAPLVGYTAQHAEGQAPRRHNRNPHGGEMPFQEKLRIDRLEALLRQMSGANDGGPGGGVEIHLVGGEPRDQDGLAKAAGKPPLVRALPAGEPGLPDDRIVVGFPEAPLGGPPTDGDSSDATASRRPSLGAISHGTRVTFTDPVADQPAVDPANDFTFGLDDPRGLLCPLGAHIRRANPRDSLQPGDAQELEISNRHRLLRRGRAYQKGREKGLLFMALCADLERQFEFVQQTWVGSPSFHGLTDEPDPIAAGAEALCPHAGGRREQVFTIPTPVGAVTVRDVKSFVSTVAGGYFFLPSRSALAYLHDLPEPEA